MAAGPPAAATDRCPRGPPSRCPCGLAHLLTGHDAVAPQGLQRRCRWRLLDEKWQIRCRVPRIRSWRHRIWPHRRRHVLSLDGSCRARSTKRRGKVPHRRRPRGSHGLQAAHSGRDAAKERGKGRTAATGAAVLPCRPARGDEGGGKNDSLLTDLKPFLRGQENQHKILASFYKKITVSTMSNKIGLISISYIYLTLDIWIWIHCGY